MISFLICWVSAVATVTPVLVLMAFAAWGRPISAWELISLAGSVCLGVGAFISLYKRRAARLLVLATAFTQWIYLAPALRTAASNVSRGGSYPLQAFIPAVFARSRNEWRDSRATVGGRRVQFGAWTAHTITNALTLLRRSGFAWIAARIPNPSKRKRRARANRYLSAAVTGNRTNSR
jgi:hypothetical protein